MITVETEVSKTKQRPKIDTIQPLAWKVTTIPEEIGQIYALKLPDRWRTAIQSLDKVDRVSPVRSLYASLHVLAPEIIYFFPYAFARDPEYHPRYWFITEAFGETLDTERLLWGVQSWLNACYPHAEAAAVANQLKVSELEWEVVNLRTTTPDVIEAALPGLIARWLLQQGFTFQLSNDEGHIATWPVRLAPSRGPEVDLVTWPPISVPRRQSEPSYSYYLKFRLGSLPWTEDTRLLCQPGIRRWVSQPLVRTNGNGKRPYIDLPWGREKSVFIARQSKSWLSKRPTETSLLRLGLTKYYDVKWVGHLLTVVGNEEVPEPMLLLAQPDKFQPDILIVHDNLMSEKHPVGLGIETADRWEVFTQLNSILPPGIKPAPLWHKTGGFNRTQYGIAHKPHSQIQPAMRLNGVCQMQAPALIEICSADAIYWKKILLEELGLPTTMLNKDVVEVAQNGASSVSKIIECQQSADLLTELPPSASDNNESQYSAERSRARLIERTLQKTDANAGVLVEMHNYKEISKSVTQARRDPKRAVRWGLAKTGRVSQFTQPEADSPDNYEQRVRNSVRDLLRQMDFHFNPLYTGYKKTALPDTMHILGFWQIRLNPRQRGEHKVTLPLAIYAPPGEHKLNVCIPGDNGPTWCSYRKALLTVPDFSGEYTTKNGIRNFFAGSVKTLDLSEPTLVLLSEHNLRDIWPELTDNHLSGQSMALSNIFSIDNENLRIARLRFSGGGQVPLVCPTHTFGKFTGLYRSPEHKRVFYSIQKRPITAARPSGLRQRDAWRRLSWNPSTVEIVMIRLQSNDVPEEWAWVVHRLREESSHTDCATLLPEPLHSASKVAEYIFRIAED